MDTIMMSLVNRASLIVLLFVTGGNSFFPNNIGLDISKDDYTIESITREAIVTTTARFLQGQLPNNTALSLETLNPLTESSLFNAYYGGQVSAKKFSGNTLSVATSAMKFCRHDNQAALFLNEEIAEGLALLLSLRADLHRALSKPDNVTNYDVIREMIGAIICVQSSFYSNTNWVEINDNKLYEDLGVTGGNVISLADSSLATCIDCRNVNESFNCTDNLINGVGLTSGYLNTKPSLGLQGSGKCSHGGLTDASQNSPATGGINKETSNSEYSPHHYLHQTAGRSAVLAAIELFLNPDSGVVALLGAEKFKTLFSLGSGVTLCVVMDTTGSMWDDINAVKAQTQNLLAGRSGTVHLPEAYIFVPFADPDTGPVQQASTGAEFLQILDAVVPHGGEDCPELALQGILSGLKASAEFSKIFIFTDADAKDGNLKDKVIATALSKQIALEFLLTGKCAAEETIYQDLYSTIASKTGGNVFYSSKSDISKASQVIDLLSGADQVSLLSLTTDGQRDYNIPVDETLRDFSVFISSETGTYLPGMSLLSPQADVRSTEIQTTNLVAYKVKNATLGNWRLHLDSPVPGLKVEVVGASSLNVHLQIFEQTAGGNAFPIIGNPVAGKEVILGLSILSSTGLGNFSTVTLIDGNGKTISTVPLTYDNEDFMTALVTVPNKAFRVMLTGVDRLGNTVHRLVNDYYEPQDFRLELDQPTPIRVNPEVPIEIPFTVENYGASTQNFTVTISDANGLFNATFVVSASASGNGSGVFLLDLQGLNLTQNSDLGSLSVVISGSSASGTVSTNYNSFRVYLTNETAITASDIVVEYILPTTLPPPTTPNTGASGTSGQDDTLIIVGAVSGAAALAGVVSVITLRQWKRGCGRVGPYSYPKPKPTVAKPNLKKKFSFS